MQTRKRSADRCVPVRRSVVTPNSFEAELLTGRDVRDDASALAACDALHDMGPHTVVRRVASTGF